ncbi:hypothetical protein DY000_02062724 [Brassica cretica]|uniref:Remorin C-terminal domain-containing protein n=1 Tax=Brassica cretica TaxID=69181 RepID=A0ABQ7ATZ5_BRACR|nr:hypothetical protein DY000_02062724 [Brassica cretica]
MTHEKTMHCKPIANLDRIAAKKVAAKEAEVAAKKVAAKAAEAAAKVVGRSSDPLRVEIMHVSPCVFGSCYLLCS